MNIDVQQMEDFLHEVDKTFPTPLSHKQDLHTFAIKLTEKATICAEVQNDRILSAVAGYTEDVIDNMAYISIVATLAQAQGCGYASGLVRRFVMIAEAKGLRGVHLYTAANNTGAIRMYEHLGFERLVLAKALDATKAIDTVVAVIVSLFVRFRGGAGYTAVFRMRPFGMLMEALHQLRQKTGEQ